MKKIEYLLVVLGEECAEAAQQTSKVIRGGMTQIEPGQTEDNWRRLERELADIMATAELLELRIPDQDKEKEIEHPLIVLVEKCAETVQRASKAIRFGMTEIEPGQTENNRRRLECKLADIMAMARLRGLRIRDEDKDAKRKKLEKFMEYSREIGILEKE